MAPWRSNPVTQSLLLFLNSEIQAGYGLIAEALEGGKLDESRAYLGRVRAFEALLTACFPPEAPIEESEPDFVDPASIRRPAK